MGILPGSVRCFKQMKANLPAKRNDTPDAAKQNKKKKQAEYLYPKCIIIVVRSLTFLCFPNRAVKIS